MGWFRCKWVKCGKAGCRSCPHGPYWYERWRDDESKCHERYKGKGDPREDAEEPAVTPPQPPHPHDAIFDSRQSSRQLALEIMGAPSDILIGGLKTLYRRLMLLHHPDRGGEEIVCKRIICAYEYLTKT